MPAITKEEIIAIAIAELSQETLGYTEEFLKIHRVAIQDNTPAVEHVRILEDGTATVYFKVHDEEFFFAVSVDMEKKEVRWSYSEDKVEISFNIDSETLSYDELTKLTHLKPDWGWNKDPEAVQRWKRVTRIGFQPYKEPDDVFNMLEKLLTCIETDAESICKISETETVYISISITTHNGNNHLGQTIIPIETLKRIVALNASVSIDMSVAGNLYKEPDWETYFDDDDNDSKEEG
jgi:hypothetical protein